MRTSANLKLWSRPTILMRPTLPWHKTSNILGNLGNPCLSKINRRYLLYYSAGLTYLPDCRFCEPKYTGVAFSQNLSGPFIPQKSPQSPLPNRVYKTESGYLGLQTHFSFDSGLSTASIRLLTSSDGLTWTAHKKPLILPNKPWKQTHIYIADLKQIGSDIRLYYNARNSRGWLSAESIGLAFTKI